MSKLKKTSLEKRIRNEIEIERRNELSKLRKIMNDLDKLKEKGWEYEIILAEYMQGGYFEEGERYFKDVKKETFLVTLDRIIPKGKMLCYLDDIPIFSNHFSPTIGWFIEARKIDEQEKEHFIYEDPFLFYGPDSYQEALDEAVKIMNEIEEDILK